LFDGRLPWRYDQHDYFEAIRRHDVDPRGKGMHHLRRLWLLLLAISFLTPARGTEVGEGVIQGVVLGEGGRPVGGAKVHAELKGVAMAKLIRNVETDENGLFVIDRLEFGTYYVAATNEEEGYGDSGFSFFNEQPVPMAQISDQHRIADVVVNLAPKAGILTGTISDAATGKPIPAGFDLAQVKDRTKWMGTSAAPNFRVLIPPSKEMEVKVSAPGYEAWVYPDPTIPSQVLRLDPGSEMHLNIKLKPAPDRSLPLSKFLIPEGYVGWLRVEYDVECFPPIPSEDGVRILRFTDANVLETSSPMPGDAAERQYFYYSADGLERDLAADYGSGNGMIWQERRGSRGGKMSMFIFFVGTEEQTKPRPLPGFPPPACP
jgi:hypothetical protein